MALISLPLCINSSCKKENYERTILTLTRYTYRSPLIQFNMIFILEFATTNKDTERGGSVVTDETRIREVPGSNPVPTNLTEVFSWFSPIIKANAWLDFHYHDPFDHYSPNSYIRKLIQ